MHTGAPYRSPCNGWYRQPYKGGCFQHRRKFEVNTPVYTNETRVDNFLCPQSPAKIYPYERPSTYDYGANCEGIVDSQLPCDPDYCDNPHTKPPCGAWARREFTAACTLGQVQLDVNCYVAANETIDLSRCQKVGFKNVQARKYWHGEFSFTSTEGDNCGDSPPYGSPDGTKYRKVRRVLSGQLKQWDIGLEGYRTYYLNWVREYVVNRFSGIVTETDWAETWSPTNGGESPMPIQVNVLGEVIYCGAFTYPPLNDGGLTTTEADYGLAGWHVSATSVGATHATYTLVSPTPRTTAWEGEITFTADLSVVYLAEGNDSLDADVKGLLAQWDLSNDRVYPWRTDRYTTVAPLVTYDEVPQPIGLGTVMTDWGEGHYTDPLADFYTGAVLGRPFTSGWPEMRTTGSSQSEVFVAPSAGTTYQLQVKGITAITVARYNVDDELQATGSSPDDYTLDCSGELCTVTLTTPTPPTINPLATVDTGDYLRVTYDYYWVRGGHFDWRHKNTLCRQVLGAWQCTHYYGAYSGGSGGIDPSDASMPYTASQWTNSDNASLFPHGAWKVAYAPGLLWAQKYAEIKLPWKSQNWFGPCGRDRDVKTGQTCAEVGGLCVQTGGTLAWPDAWPIEGDRAIANKTESSGTVRVSFDIPALYLRVNDHVDFTDDGGTVTVADKTVTAVDAGGEWFEFSGTIPAGTRVKSHDAPGFWWYDNDGKGDYVYYSHVTTYRNSETTTGGGTQSCIEFKRCYPAVLCFSPNYSSSDPLGVDGFDHGHTYAFGSFTPDYRFGSRWQGFFWQCTPDRIWKVPDPPCEFDLLEENCLPKAGWQEDSGQCVEDNLGVAAYYAHRPMVEAREAMPAAWVLGDSQPTWTTDTYTHEPAPAVGGAEHGGPPNIPAEEYTPWQVWIWMQGCICATGRFTDDYENILGAWVCGSEP